MPVALTPLRSDSTPHPGFLCAWGFLFLSRPAVPLAGHRVSRALFFLQPEGCSPRVTASLSGVRALSWGVSWVQLSRLVPAALSQPRAGCHSCFFTGVTAALGNHGVTLGNLEQALNIGCWESRILEFGNAPVCGYGKAWDFCAGGCWLAFLIYVIESV